MDATTPCTARVKPAETQKEGKPTVPDSWLTKGHFPNEGTLSSSVANMALARLTLLSHSLCLAKNRWITFLNLAPKVYSLIWLLLPLEADYQGPDTKVLKSCNQKFPLLHLINMPSQNIPQHPGPF